MDIIDVPTRVALKKVKKFDLYSEFDDETAEDYRDFMSWFMRKDDALLEQIPSKDSTGFFIEEFEESAFNTCDFQKDTPKFDRYGYRIRKVMERVRDLAMQYSCVESKEGKVGVRKMFDALMQSEFLIEAMKAMDKGDTWKGKRLCGHAYKRPRCTRILPSGCRHHQRQFSPLQKRCSGHQRQLISRRHSCRQKPSSR
jgi:hypothetical protein